MAKPKLSSKQEVLVEELIQSSFGAQFLYAPKLFKRGKNENEPCDLMWFGNDVLVLFYLTDGKKSIQKQDEHNLKQIRRWNAFWDRSRSVLLEGINRYGDEIAIQYNDVKQRINISVIGHKVGIVFHPLREGSKNEITCTIPESLIHDISDFHGTVVDLMAIIHAYSHELQRHLLNHTVTAPDRLKAIVDRRVGAIKNLVNKSSFSPQDEKDLDFIYGIIERNRLSDPFGNALTGGDGNPREKMVAYFSDLSAYDYVVIAIAAKEVIKNTENGRKSIVAYTDGLHTNWVIIATELGIGNFNEILTSFYESIEKSGKMGLPQIVYGHPRDVGDYRSPLMFVFPKGRGSSQVADLAGLIFDRLRKIFSIRN